MYTIQTFPGFILFHLAETHHHPPATQDLHAGTTGPRGRLQLGRQAAIHRRAAVHEGALGQRHLDEDAKGSHQFIGISRYIYINIMYIYIYLFTYLFIY